jgi:hypothetical protein
MDMDAGVLGNGDKATGCTRGAVSNQALDTPRLASFLLLHSTWPQRTVPHQPCPLEADMLCLWATMYLALPMPTYSSHIQMTPSVIQIGTSAILADLISLIATQACHAPCICAGHSQMSVSANKMPNSTLLLVIHVASKTGTRLGYQTCDR